MDQPLPHTTRLRRSLVAMFVDRPVTSLMCAVAILTIGLLAVDRTPLQLMPNGISANSLNIYVPIRQDMPPREVEELVLRPFEEQLRTIPGIRKISAEGSSSRAMFRIELEQGVDPVLAGAEIRDRAQRARLEWPSEVDQYFTWREDMSSAPLAFCQIRTPERDPDWDFKIDEVVRPRLEAVDGVGRVEIWGLIDETLRILFDRDKLVEHRIDYGELIRRLGQDNFVQPVGELDNGSERYMVRVDTKFRSREEIARYPIRPGLTVGDIASVEDIPSVRDSLSKVDGKFTYTAVIRLQSGANPIEASDNAKVAIAELEAEAQLAGMSFVFLFDQGATIRQSLETLLETSLQGGALALLALFLFLRNIRLTLIVALAMPLALMVATSYLFFAGDTMNIVTMAGLTLAVGMVVDNSVVVLENIRRRRQEGASLRSACVDGAREMVLPVTMATLTTVVVILPLVFMGSDQNIKVTLAALGLPLSIALLGSLAIALWLLPAATRKVGTGAQHPNTKIGFSSRFHPIEWLLAVNRLVLGPATRSHVGRFAMALVCLGLCATIRLPASKLTMATEGGGGPFSRGDVTINLEIPRGLDLGDVHDEVRQYEEFLDARRADYGLKTIASRFSRTSARFDLTLEPEIPKEEHTKIGQRIRAEWPRRPGITVALRDRGSSMGGGQATAEAASKNFVLRLWGPDSEFLMAKALELRDRIARRPEVASIEAGGSDATEEVIVSVDRELLNERGVRPEALEWTMSSGLRGRELTRFEETGREVRLIAQYDSEQNPSLFDLRETQVFSQGGAFQRLADITDIRFQRSLDEINRIDGKTHVTLVGERAPDVDPGRMALVLREIMQSSPLPRGYSWSEESASNDVMLQLQELLDAAWLSITLVFLLMAILFESLVLPGAILATVPFALLGAYWSLWAFHGSMDVMAGIGMLLLAGIVVNNGIVLLDCIERLRRDGVDRRTALLEGARIRLRPIFMTATTTIVGLLPMAVFGESTGEGISYVSMSIAVSGGLLVSTLFTAVAVPIAYLYLDDLSNWGRGVLVRMGRSASRGGQATRTGAPA
jgi:HAE1 family hydrophobic/amphiphilic exporter-1